MSDFERAAGERGYLQPDPDVEGDDDVEIVEVVGLEEDSPGAAPARGAGEESVLRFDDPERTAANGRADPIESGREPSMQERWMRLKADFDNFKRRADRERRDYENRATETLVLRMLPVLDNFERALESPELRECGPIRDGVVLIFRQLLDELRKEGLSAIESVGQPFDPEIHEAVASDSPPGGASYTVVQELHRGYRLNGNLLRSALVKVQADSSEE